MALKLCVRLRCRRSPGSPQVRQSVSQPHRACPRQSEVENRHIKEVTDTFTLIQVVDVIVVSRRRREAEKGGKHCREHQAEAKAKAKAPHNSHPTPCPHPPTFLSHPPSEDISSSSSSELMHSGKGGRPLSHSGSCLSTHQAHEGDLPLLPQELLHYVQISIVTTGPQKLQDPISCVPSPAPTRNTALPRVGSKISDSSLGSSRTVKQESHAQGHRGPACPTLAPTSSGPMPPTLGFHRAGESKGLP